MTACLKLAARTTGYNCIKEQGGKDNCMKYCPKIGGCTVMGSTITFDTQDRTSTLCFSAYTKDTRSTKKSWELELIDQQYMSGAAVTEEQQEQ